MKYLKLFENKSEYYFQINQRQYVYLRKEAIDMEESNINKIIPVNYKPSSITDQETYYKLAVQFPIHIWIRPSSGKYLHIHQCRDEYFIVSVDYAAAPPQHYKCDQIDGVLQLLKDKRIR